MLGVVFLCFFLSGASALVFESVWTRELTLVFGSTTLAISTVLTVFMGGLALGSYLAGRIADRAHRRLLLYAIAEIGIGLYALLVPTILTYYPALTTRFHLWFGESIWLLTAARLAASAILLLLPTTLMGATLPLLIRHLSALAERRRGIGVASGTLYAVNTLGAVLGTFVAGFVLFPRFGIKTTNALAASGNLVAGFAILLATRLRPRRLDGAAPMPPTQSEPPSEEARVIAGAGARSMALYGVALSGGSAMVVQVLWTRALAIVLGSSVYSFTLILLVFLIGLAAGSFVVSRLTRKIARVPECLAVVHAVTAVLLFASSATMDHLPQAFLTLLSGDALSVDAILVAQGILAVLAILPTTFAMGAVLPLTLRLYATDTANIGAEVGRAYAVNTLGAILGSFVAGFFVLPMVGLEKGLAACAIVSAILASAFVLVSTFNKRGFFALLPPTLAVTWAIFSPKWNLEHFSAGLFRVSIAKDILESKNWMLPKLELYKDGIATTVSVERWGKTLALKNNGKVDASNGDDMSTQIMVGLMPFLFHPSALVKPPEALVIGFGSGVTIGATTQFPIAHADVVELEPIVVDAGVKYFGEVNHHPERDPRISIHIDDGRNFLQGSQKRYDIIVSEPSNPWITGVSNLFTTDYWQLARSRLKDDGVFCQWAQLYEMSSPNIKIILRSFSSVFPYTYVFSAEDLSSDVIMVAANHPLALDVQALRKNFDNPTLKAELIRGGVPSAEDLLAYTLLTPDEIPAFTAGSPLNTDDNALIEFAAPRDLLTFSRYDPYLARVYGTDWPYGHFDRFLTGLGEGQARVDTELRLVRALLAHGKRSQAQRFLTRAMGHGAPPDHATARLAAAFAELLPDTPEPPLGALDPVRVAEGLADKEVERIRRDADKAMQEAAGTRWAHALHAIRDWPDRYVDDAGPDFQLFLGMVLYKADLAADAVDRLKPLIEDEAYVRKRPALLYYLARAEYGAALYEPAVRYMERFLETTSIAPSSH